MRPVRLLALLCLLALAACAGVPMVWTKPGLTQAQLSLDLEECRVSAWRESMIQRQEEEFYRQLRTPWPLWDPRTRSYWPYSGYGAPWGPWSSGMGAFGMDNDPFRESRLQSFCLRSKGYTLVPATGSGGH
jgi:hypothetical protein